MPPKCCHNRKPKYEENRRKKSKSPCFLLSMALITFFPSCAMIGLRDSQEDEAKNNENETNENK